MMHIFSKKDLEEGKKLLDEKRVESVLFSEGTYQIEVITSKKPKKVIWPFLQLSDTGEVIDAFCNCEAAEKKGSCPHLAAAYQKVMKDEPLHVRFRESLWNQIGLICAERQGYEPSCLKHAGHKYETFDKEGKRLFSMTVKSDKRLKEILFNRPVETEETSIKFSNLPQEELLLWREGRPSPEFRYELSFWSDLAKWWMMLQEEKVDYTLSFSDEKPPHFLKVKFPEIEIEFFIDPENWENLIPALETVDSPLKVHRFPFGKIKQIVFLKEQGAFSLEYEEEEKGQSPLKNGDEIKIGDWLYFPEKGFYPREIDPFFEKKIIEQEYVGEFFNRHLILIQKFLLGEKINPNPVSVSYELSLDPNYTFHIKGYLFEKGDMQKKGAHYFGDWAYLPNQGFFHLENQIFEESYKKIPKEKISEFINRHRVWLNNYEGFQTHVSGVESHLGYHFKENGNLAFFTRLEFTEETEAIADLGEWIYVKGKGFYSKVFERPGAFVKPGLEVESFDIPSFLHKHHDELEQTLGFFSKKCPLKRSGLHIGFNSEGKIEIRPEFFFAESYTADRVKIYGDYTFVEGEGFSLIPRDCRLPESYKTKKVVSRLAEPNFVNYELELLYPRVLAIDSRLKMPKKIALRLNGLKSDQKSKTGQWILELVYETDIGQVSVYEIWKAIWEGKQYLFSNAGLLFVHQKRFEWLRLKNKKSWLKKGESLRITTLEFLRLSGLEDILLPEDESKKAKDTRKLFEKFLNFQAETEIDLTGLKSQLRIYQKTGVDWLWFLHSYGLSGLLCDEMGLGKTHQAMALIVGIKNLHKNRKAKFLVVCPTSVIYHWEKLIKTFLPCVTPYVFHGIGRRFEAFSEDSHDLLLTSYGIVRTENKALSSYHFDLAVFDELQVAKNEKSQTHKALLNIDATMRLGLTGTPIENRLLELKALFDLVLPNYLPSKNVFRNVFITPIEKGHDEEKRFMLSRLIHPFLLRRKKSEVLTELPEKIEEVIFCDLSEEQRELYHQIVVQSRDALLAELKDLSKPPPIAHIFSMLSKLKQVCNHPSLILKDIKNYQKYTSGKWDLFLELLEETRDSGQKLVVFSQYLGMLDIIAMHLKKEKIEFAQIRGSTRDRKEQVERFDKDPECKIFLGSLQAAGVGIDLTAASVVIHYDRWWNPAKENQATDRVHRMGQKRGVQVFKLGTQNTIEEHIDRLIERKLSLTKGVISFDDHEQIKGLERQELIELLTLLD